MKLNYKRTFFVGLAFMSICAFWQVYDNVIPLILKDTFHVRDSYIGIVMAMDNVLALFMLPLFGKLSDKTRTKIGRRMPYILGGTILALLCLAIMPAAQKQNNALLFFIGLGLLLFFSQIRLPALLAGPVASLSALNTPLAMLIAGVNLAGSDIWGSMKNPRIYWIGFVKLIIIPLVTLAMLILLLFNFLAMPWMALVGFICAACPTGAMTTLFALKYNRNARYASEAFCSTTIFSLVTMPVLTLLAGAVL